MSVFESKGRWVFEYRGSDGALHRQIGGRNRKETEKMEARIMAAVADDAWTPPLEARRIKTARMGTWADLVAAFLKARTCQPQSVKNYSVILNRVGEVLAPETRLNALTPSVVRGARVRLAALGSQRTGEPLTRSSLNLFVTIWRAVFLWADRTEVAGLRPGLAAHIESFRAPGSRGGVSTSKQISAADFFTEEEIAVVQAKADSTETLYNATMLATAFGSGARRGEVGGLRWADVSGELITIRRSYTGTRKKSGPSRTIPISTALAARLKVWRLASPASLDDDAVFPRLDGKPYRNDIPIAPVLARVAAAAEVSKPRFYANMTRHSYASNWLRRGESDWTLAKILGHRDTTLIHHVYAHCIVADLVAAVARLSTPR